MLHITFNSIKFHEACEEGYDPLSIALGGDIKYGMDTPISLIKCLESNPIDDVIWALRATLENSKEFSKQFAIACAEHVLPIFEEKYPEDKRPRLALEAAKAGKLTKEILEAAYAAVSAYCTAAYAAAAYAAAYYAAAAAADAAVAARSSHASSDYNAAACSSRAAAADYDAERQWQKKLLIKMLSKH